MTKVIFLISFPFFQFLARALVEHNFSSLWRCLLACLHCQVMWPIDVARTHHPCMKIDMKRGPFLILIVKPILLGTKRFLCMYINASGLWKLRIDPKKLWSFSWNSSLEFFLSRVGFSFYLIFCARYEISLLLLEILVLKS